MKSLGLALKKAQDIAEFTKKYGPIIVSENDITIYDGYME